MLSADDILDAKLVMDISSITAAIFGYQGDSAELRFSEIASQALANLTPPQEAKVLDILAQWRPIQYDRDTLKVEGLDNDPARTRRHLRDMMYRAIGLIPGGGNGGRLRMARG